MNFATPCGIPDLDRRLDTASVLALCSDAPLPEKSRRRRVMGVDVGKLFHAVVLLEDENAPWGKLHNVVHLGEHRSWEDIDILMKQYDIQTCVIDAMPEIHATREFAKRHSGRVYMNYFNENQRGKPNFDVGQRIVTVNRTEALDASRAAIRDKKLRLPQRSSIVETFARHMANDVKVLDEDETTGALKYRYNKVGTNHFSLACAYAWLATVDWNGGWGWIMYMDEELRRRGLRRPD